MNTFELFWSIVALALCADICVFIYLFIRTGEGGWLGLGFGVTVLVLYVGGMSGAIIEVDEIEEYPLTKIGKVHDITVGFMDLHTWTSSDNSEIYSTPDSLICMQKTISVDMFGSVDEEGDDVKYELVKCKDGHI